MTCETIINRTTLEFIFLETVADTIHSTNDNM